MRRCCNYAHGVSVLSFSFSRFLNELHLGKLSETVVVHGNAPHNRPRFLVSHLIGNRASFLCTKAPMLRGHDKVSGWHRISSAASSIHDCSPSRLTAAAATSVGFKTTM